MKKMKLILGGCVLLTVGLFLYAADHIDAPAVSGGSSDITDFYAFQAEDTNNIVFVANVQGLLSPTATEAASFDENVLIEFNIDTDADAVEDLVIQAIPRDGKMYFFGPFAPGTTGLNSTIGTSSAAGSVDISAYNNAPAIGYAGDMKFFAGPRDDPFFMDFAQYGEIVGGNASSFNNPGSDTFAGSNVMSIVIEVPKSTIGGSGSINTWVESKVKS
ncbi:molecular chaperone DnaK [Tenacibaculum todarodis]|uniref:Molecular chaperone DnaK n=1 Tax=Tenacibaculum todarodis TaxID=1850252 RepID=A0A1L3JG17_9FLAO|nr:DUF4331 family protein [Tenacibaculum todarodis]APG64062.1 molecular chaperone DnaK [Tenacibaculum todarodis]